MTAGAGGGANCRRPGIFDANEIYKAYLDCRRRKRGKPGAIAFEMHLADELTALSGELKNRTYRPNPSLRFVAGSPKKREIIAAEFRDRVVHHLLVRELEPDWERSFIHDSYACREGKGTHAAVARMSEYMGSVTAGGRKKAWFLQADIKSFFVSINRSILFARIERRLRRRFRIVEDRTAQLSLPFFRDAQCADDFKRYSDLSWLTRLLVFHDPLEGCRSVGDKAVFNEIPVNKTLAGAEKGCGLPIGNLTSQFFANVYLDALDQFVKHKLKAGRYIRYVDDFVLLAGSKEELARRLAAIEVFLNDELHLQLNRNRLFLKPVSCGVDFLGYVVHPTHRLARRRVVGNLRQRLHAFEKALVRKEKSQIVCFYPADLLPQLISVMNSYLAHFAWSDSRRLVASIVREYWWLGQYFPALRLHRQGMPCPYRILGRNLREQHAHFRGVVGDGLLLIKIGMFYEMFEDDADTAHDTLALQKINPRPGFTRRAGFCSNRLAPYEKRLKELGVGYTVVAESGKSAANLKERCISRRVFHLPEKQEAMK